MALPSRTAFLSATLAASVLAATGSEEPTPGGPDFARDVRPLLADHCFLCHGPDGETREADLRLDRRESAFADRGGYAAVVPGDPGASELYRRVTDEHDPMPPPGVDDGLTAAEKELLRRWIEEGAPWSEHWAYVPPVRPELPALPPGDAARHPVDRFVRARLEEEGLAPSPAADRATLLRRVTLDLTGVPPTIGELDAFLADERPDAYERVVDRLLASPRYGETMARWWLDAARYGDTHGYHLDNERSIWPYRDWVIRAFDENKPFDEFTVEQLAGDLLPGATLEQRVATGFNRCNPTTAEGGLIAEEYLAKYAADRVETTATVWLGTTMGCAACHDHKYDPFTQEEFYQLFAFFNSIDEDASDGNAPDPKPVVRVPGAGQQAELARLEGALAALEERLEGPLPEVDRAQAAWERGAAEAARARWLPLAVTGARAQNASVLSIEGDVVRASGPNPETEVYVLEATTPSSDVRALRIELLRDRSTDVGGVGRAEHGNVVLTDVSLEAVPLDGSAGLRPVPIATAHADHSQVGFEVAKAIDDDPRSGWAVDSRPEERVAVFTLAEPVAFLAGARLRLRLAQESAHPRHNVARLRLSVTEDPTVRPADLGPWWRVGPFEGAGRREVFDTEYGPERGVDLGEPVAGLAWTEHPEYADGRTHLLPPGDVASTYLVRTIHAPTARRMTLSLGSDDGLRVWVRGEEVLARDVARPVGADQERLEVSLEPGANELLLKVSNYGGGFGFYFHALDEDVGGLPFDVERFLAGSSEEPPDVRDSVVRRWFRSTSSGEWRRLDAEREAARERLAAAEAAIPTTMVMAERGEPRPAHLLVRGQYDQPGAAVARDVPSVLPPLPPPAAEGAVDRLTLARWLTDPAHPLVARVTVNRLWQELFGAGLVETSEDFGSRGSPPTHPALLDWLAVELVESGWDVRGMLRLLVTSATYRQSAARGADARDPENRLLARGPRFRLGAEAVRDSALLVSGLLVERVGGPSVKPYQPPGIWRVVGYTTSNTASFVRDSGDALYRRSLYTFWKRTAPPPTMQIFDAPTREACVVKRARTNTPLQALALLNDEQFVEAARAFGQRMLLEGGETAEERIAFGFRCATARRPSEGEARVLAGLVTAALARFRADPDAARALLAVGESQPDPALDPAELAAWTLVASTLFNLDAFVTRG